MDTGREKMDPVTIAYGAGAAANALANLFNGWAGRKQFAQENALSRADTERRFQQDIGLRREDLQLREATLIFTQQDAQANRIQRLRERAEDFRRQGIRDTQNRSFDRLRHAFHASPDGWWLHDPHLHANPGINSLRILFQRPKGLPEQFSTEVEHSINAGIKAYNKGAIGYPISFPSGVWVEGCPPGSWTASELHAWDQNVPTLILRANKTADGAYALEADLFGFPIGDSAFQQGVILGKVSAKPEEVAQILSLVAAVTADLYFLSTYAKAPRLPAVLPHLISGGDDKNAKLIGDIVAGYQASANMLLADSPDIGLYASLELARALMSLDDKSHAIRQLKEAEAIGVGVLATSPELRQKFKDLYTQAGVPQEAERLLQSVPEQKKLLPPADPTLVERHL